MSTVGYVPRVIDEELAELLRSSPVVVLEGPKACGKTFSARRAAASEVLLDVDDTARAAAAVDPTLILDGDVPRLIDEWQVEPKLWNHIRRLADDRGRPGQFILSGSAVPPDDATRHTGAGRIARIRMRPFSLFEAGYSIGAISLEALLAGEAPRSADSGLALADIADRITVGGWPGFRQLSVGSGARAVASYLDEIRRTDINRIDDSPGRRGRDRDPARVARLLHSLARNVSTAAAITKIADDTAEDEHDALARNTIYDYVHALERLMIVEDQPAWKPHLRSRWQLRVTPKRHFVDPSLAVAALGASPERLLRDLNYLGLLFESLVIRDLRIYAQRLDATVLYYADNSGLEVDTIVEARDGRWAGFEVKLGGDALIEEGAANLCRFRDQVDTTKIGEPSCLGIITATGYGYLRKEGNAVIRHGGLTA